MPNAAKAGPETLVARSAAALEAIFDRAEASENAPLPPCPKFTDGPAVQLVPS
jgi:hypothetical protein